MKTNLLTLLFVAILTAFLIQPALAQSETPTETESGEVVCAPGTLHETDDCAMLGAPARIAKLAENGLAFPPMPLLYRQPPYEYNFVPFSYFRADSTGIGIYPSLGAAESRAGASRIIEPGFIYLTYVQRVEQANGVYYMNQGGTWFPGDGSRVTPPIFQGVLLQRTPRTAFGWVLGQVETKREPNYYFSNPTVRTMYRYNLIQIYAQREVDGTRWLQIGAGEWIEARHVSAVYPNTNPPAGVTNGRWIEINLEQQTISVYDNYKLIFATLVSSGTDPYWTQPGLFQIYEKKELETMSGAFAADRSDYYYLENVPWTMYYDQLRAIHGAYWHTFLGYERSHGCVNLSIGDAKWMYDWANVGDWVWVHDPSGRTPTDPALYGEGGA
jgi:hypothetical protein